MAETFLYQQERYKRSNYFSELLSGIFKTTRDHKEDLTRNDFLLRQIETEHSKNHELNESIAYAKRIQEGMMLKEKHLFRLFPESFLLFRPKDIVSGDFYWFTKIGSKIVIAVADCTGHGIPGAFMSVLGISLLNQIVIEEQNASTSSILQRLDHKLKKAFSYSPDYQEDEKSYDGMDIGICSIDHETQMIEFAGALRPLYHLNESGLNEIKGSRYPIGGLHLEKDRPYTTSSFNFAKGDKIYLSTDGFADQFGGKENKKFMTKKLKQVLHKTSRYSMNTQHQELERLLSEWKGNSEQTDDILIIGFQL
jgi:serine phosphatase RsbU (regulator of sigma subunit)